VQILHIKWIDWLQGSEKGESSGHDAQLRGYLAPWTLEACLIYRFEPMAPWSFTLPPNTQVWELVVFYILYSINIIKTVSYTLVNKIMCSITLHRPLWEHLENRRAGQGTHLSKGSSTTIRTVVDITATISHLREMHKSCSLYVYVWMCVLCHMVYVCETMWMIWCMFKTKWMIMCMWWYGWICYIYVMNLLYICAWFFYCDTWRKQIRQHFWVLFPLTSMSTCNSRWKLVQYNFCEHV
jgi:hypothetical protein